MKNSGGIFENVCEEPMSFCAIGDLRIKTNPGCLCNERVISFSLNWKKGTLHKITFL